MYKDSIYTKMYQHSEKLLHTGYDYRSRGLTNRWFAKRMFLNPLMEGFIAQIEPYFVEILDSVKKLQFYKNYTIDKNDGTINN